VAAHLAGGPTGLPGKFQIARRLSPPLLVLCIYRLRNMYSSAVCTEKLIRNRQEKVGVCIYGRVSWTGNRTPIPGDREPASGYQW